MAGNAERVQDHRWKPGQSGNPGGRPKGLARQTRELVGDDGMPLAQLWWEIASDPLQKTGDRLEASRLLADRGWGKAAQFTAQEGDPLGIENADEAAEQFRSSIIRLVTNGDKGEAAGGGVEAEPARPEAV